MVGIDLNGEAIEKLLDAAQAHGDDLGSDMQVGDLEELVRRMWELVTPQQRQAVWHTEEARALLNELPGKR